MRGTLLFLALPLSCAAPPLRTPDKVPSPLRETLESADRFELLSIDPYSEYDQKPGERIRDFRILGKIVVQDATRRRQILSSVYRAIETFKGGPALCFIPRHVIHAERAGRVVDLVICFQCTRIHAYDAEGKKHVIPISPDAEPTLSGLLRSRGIEIAK